MGEVYRARDTRLDRDVALKVLPEAFALDPGRVRRFEGEARAASALNHPNIVTVYDMGSVGSLSYIAMELVEGKTLREALAAGPFPLKRLLDVSCQIASGLARAHEAGIVHRDLKPENVMVSRDGLVKILDFGLAKRMPFEGDAGSVATTMTQEGSVVGTVGYMSPEQASGKAVDYRSDQFALGAILYEMATSRRAFERDSKVQTLAAIVEDEPEPISSVNPKVPPPLRWVIERCLVKELKERYASTEDLARELGALRDHFSEVASSGESPVVLAAPQQRKPARRRLRPWRNPLAEAHFTRLTDWEGSELDAAISGDGRFVAFLSDRDGPFDAWVGQIGSGEFLNLTKGRYPTLANPIVHSVGFSGDDAHVWFRVNSKDGKTHSVLLVPTIGGTPRLFLPSAVEAAWSPDHTRILYYAPSPGDPIFIADRNGGNPRQICVDKPGIHQHYLTWSPDNRFVYFVRGIPPGEMDIWRIPSTGGVAERLTHHNSQVAYPTLLDKHTLIYTATRENVSGSGLYAMDVERRIPHSVSAGLEECVSVGASADGRRLVVTVANPVRDLWTVPITDQVVDDSGVRRFSLPTLRAAAPRFGPDYILYLGSKGRADGLWKLKDGSETELWKGSEGTVPYAPAISPDGAQICFAVRSEGRGQLYLMTADGTNVRRFAESLEVRTAPSWSPNGKWIAAAASEGKAYPLFKVPVDGGAPLRLVDGVNSVVSNPVWSPDGRFILYSEGQGSATVRLQGITPDKQPFPLPEVWVGNTGDRYRFLPDGKSLVVTQGVLWLQNFSLLDLATGKQRQLTNLARQIIMRSFDVSPDGKQILFDRYRQSSDLALIDLPGR
jgi:Tol biopolymer transport system component